MPKRTTPQLANGEYVSPNPENSTEVWRARMEMITIVKRVHPQFLENLVTDVFPLYCSHAKGQRNFEKTLSRPGSFERLPQSSRLKSALSDWASKFDANCGWLLDDVLRTLRGWRVEPDRLQSRSWNANHGRADPWVNGGALEVRCEGWEPQVRRWADYRAHVQERFDRVLADYEQATRKLALDAGLVRARHKYSLANLEWFVLYQFAGMSSTQVADHCADGGNPIDDTTVLKGVKTAAALIAWDGLSRQK